MNKMTEAQENKAEEGHALACYPPCQKSRKVASVHLAETSYLSLSTIAIFFSIPFRIKCCSLSLWRACIVCMYPNYDYSFLFCVSACRPSAARLMRFSRLCRKTFREAFRKLLLSLSLHQPVSMFSADDFFSLNKRRHSSPPLLFARLTICYS